MGLFRGGWGREKDRKQRREGGKEGEIKGTVAGREKEWREGITVKETGREGSGEGGKGQKANRV